MVESLTIASRVPQAEVAVADDVVRARAACARSADAPADLERLAAFEREHCRAHSTCSRAARTRSRRSIRPRAPAPLSYRLPEHDVTIEFEPTDFIQVNGALNRAMVVARARSAGAAGRRHACSTCSAASAISRCRSRRRAAQVVAVEGDAGLVARARGNAARNGIANVEFHVADLFEDVAGLPWARRPYDRVLLDPPRAGAREILPLVAGSGAQRVVYISCHSGSLARDAGLLVREHGFRLTAAGVMDMFPHTTHVEADGGVRPMRNA